MNLHGSLLRALVTSGEWIIFDILNTKNRVYAPKHKHIACSGPGSQHNKKR